MRIVICILGDDTCKEYYADDWIWGEEEVSEDREKREASGDGEEEDSDEDEDGSGSGSGDKGTVPSLMELTRLISKGQLLNKERTCTKNK